MERSGGAAGAGLFSVPFAWRRRTPEATAIRVAPGLCCLASVDESWCHVCEYTDMYRIFVFVYFHLLII